ncbi:unnamed protein product [Paramecium octaurelia]|uniref:Uncharacterized protein n=1 Tax=Paramecium octaurelia TaxID=43137 RepID=A0A8S1XPT6_PAROT|nr:unnamed protein product [Paramecium octaurelia]
MMLILCLIGCRYKYQQYYKCEERTDDAQALLITINIWEAIIPQQYVEIVVALLTVIEEKHCTNEERIQLIRQSKQEMINNVCQSNYSIFDSQSYYCNQVTKQPLETSIIKIDSNQGLRLGDFSVNSQYGSCSLDLLKQQTLFIEQAHQAKNLLL